MAEVDRDDDHLVAAYVEDDTIARQLGRTVEQVQRAHLARGEAVAAARLATAIERDLVAVHTLLSAGPAPGLHRPSRSSAVTARGRGRDTDLGRG